MIGGTKKSRKMKGPTGTPVGMMIKEFRRQESMKNGPGTGMTPAAAAPKKGVAGALSAMRKPASPFGR